MQGKPAGRTLLSAWLARLALGAVCPPRADPRLRARLSRAHLAVRRSQQYSSTKRFVDEPRDAARRARPATVGRRFLTQPTALVMRLSWPTALRPAPAPSDAPRRPGLPEAAGPRSAERAARRKTLGRASRSEASPGSWRADGPFPGGRARRLGCGGRLDSLAGQTSLETSRGGCPVVADPTTAGPGRRECGPAARCRHGTRGPARPGPARLIYGARGRPGAAPDCEHADPSSSRSARNVRDT